MLGRVGTDADLVARAREGDLNAFDRLVVRHRTRLLDLAWQLVRDREAAQDLVQEGLVQAFRALPALRDTERFGPWTNTIVRRLGQQWQRNGRRRPEPREDESLLGLPGVMWRTSPEPDSEVVERVRAALAVLSAREREVMILHYLEGRSCEEIAQRLKLPNASVRRILHYSRRKVRTEAAKMHATETTIRGPRQLSVWINGGRSSEPKGPTVFTYARWALAQSILLAVNKAPKTVAQLAEQIQAHAWYVEQMVGLLVEMDMLSGPRPGQYLATFIAFDAEDWRRLLGQMHEPAGAAAQRLAAAAPKVRAAFEQTPLAKAGWTWEELSWPIYAVFICNSGAGRHQPPGRRPGPARPDGGHYWVGGHEVVDDLPPNWALGLHTDRLPGLGYGWCMHRDIHRERTSYFGRTDRGRVVEVLAPRPHTEEDLLARLGDEAARWRGALAELMEQRLVTRTNSAYRLAFPVFRRGDSDALLPAVESVLTSVADEVAVPAFADVDNQLDEMGYQALRDQYPEWHNWLSGMLLGEAVHFLVEQGVLPRPPDPAPPNFALLAWEDELPLME